MPTFIRPDLQALAAYSSHAPVGEAHAPERVDALDTNESSYDLPVFLKEKLAWEYQNQISANRYPDGDHLALKEAIARYVQTTSPLAEGDLTTAHITVGNGSDELIRSLLIATCVGRPAAILVAEPTFSMYGILAQTLGVEVIRIGRNEATFEIDIEAAQAAVENTTAPIRMVFMVSPNSPTGNGLTVAELDWLRQLPQEILTVVDEAYFEFCQQTTVAEAIARPNWVVTRTFSKAFRLAAHRVGYAVSTPEIIQVLEKVRLPYNLPSFSQSAALLVLHHSQAVLATVDEVQSERDRLLTSLNSCSTLKVWPSVANFVYCRPITKTLDAVFEALFQQGTHIRKTGGGLRITVGTPEENTRTLDHLEHVLS